MAEGKLLIGKKFPSFQHVEKWIDKQAGPGYKFSIASSSSIRATKVKGPFADGLKYYEIYYRCSRAGKFKTKGAGIRDYKSQKTECPALITLRARDKKSLEITDCDMNHNHEKVSDDDAVSSVEPPSLSQNSDDDLDDDLESLDKSLPLTQESEELISTGNGKSVIEKSPTGVRNREMATAEWKESLTSEKYEETENKHEMHVGDDMKLSEEIEQHSDEDSASINLEVSKNFGSNTQPTHTAGASGPAEPTAKAVDVKNIVLPQKISRGRPKGRVLRAVALPKKPNKPIAFTKKSVDAKKKHILQWFAPRENIESCLNGHSKIGLAQVSDVKASSLCDGTASAVVDFVLVQPYFTPKAFKKLKRIISQKKKNALLSCAICKQPLSNNGIECDGCLLWHDFECVGISRAPKSSSAWFCPGCSTK